MMVNRLNVAFKLLLMDRRREDAVHGASDTGGVDGFAVAQFGADHDLAEPFAFVG